MAKGNKLTQRTQGKLGSPGAKGTTHMPDFKIQQGATDLDTMQEVILYKKVGFEPVQNGEEALARLGGDTAKFLNVINEGLRVESMSAARENKELPWLIENEETQELVPFTGTMADSAKTNVLVLTLAKTVFGYNKEMTPEQKKAAKEQAFEFIRSNDKVKEGLKAHAAAN